MATDPLPLNDSQTRFVRFVAGQCFVTSRGFHAADWWGSRGVRTLSWGKSLQPEWVRDAKAYSQTDRSAAHELVQQPVMRTLGRVLRCRVESNGWRVQIAPCESCRGARRKLADILATLFGVLLCDSPLTSGGVVCLSCDRERVETCAFSDLRCAVTAGARALWIVRIRVGYAGSDFATSVPGVARACRGWSRWVDSPDIKQAEYCVVLKRDLARAVLAILGAMLSGNLAERLPMLMPSVGVLFQGRSTSQPCQVALSYVEALARVHYKASRKACRKAQILLRRLPWKKDE